VPDIAIATCSCATGALIKSVTNAALRAGAPPAARSTTEDFAW